jgi:cobalamin biosynthesis protein CobD/CbiB
MDIASYITGMQDRAFLALAGLTLAFIADFLRGLLLGHRADPRPLLERAADVMLFPLASRLNRPGRSDGALIMRGAVIMIIGCVIFFSIIALALSFARQYGQGGFLMTILVASSVTATGWFASLRALARTMTDPKSPRPYFILARATYSNMVTLDDSGIIRVSVTGAVRSITMRMAAPVLLFIIFGWQVLAVYWPVMALSFIAGQDGMSRAFAALANVLATLLLVIPTFLIFPIVLVALFFSAGASFFHALPGFFKVHRWPSFLQGGVVMMVVAYAMKLTLGGPRQDRNGVGVQAAWVGSSKGTAKLETKDIGRVLYLQGVTLLLFGTTLFMIAVI